MLRLLLYDSACGGERHDGADHLSAAPKTSANQTLSSCGTHRSGMEKQQRWQAAEAIDEESALLCNEDTEGTRCVDEPGAE